MRFKRMLPSRLGFKTRRRRAGLSQASEDYVRFLTWAAKLSPAMLGEVCLGMAAQPFHLEWSELMGRHRQLILYAPMDHGKSTQMAVLGTLHALAENQDLRVAIISETAKQSTKLLGQIKANLLSNDTYRLLNPQLAPDSEGPWHQNAILLNRTPTAQLTQKDPSVQALGVGGALLGARLDLAILDDVLSPENVATEAGRKATIDWFLNTVVGRMVEGGRIWIIGTAWHEDDLPHWLAKERPGQFHIATYQAGVPPCIWPERWPPERLLERRQILGDVEYSRQMLNVPLGEATAFFTQENVRWCQAACRDPEDWWIGGYRNNGADPWLWTAAGVDLGASRASTASMTAIVVVGLAKGSLTKHVIHVRAGHWVGAELLRNVVDVHRAHRPREWVVESNAAQVHIAELLKDPGVLQSVGADRTDVSTLRVIAQYTGENKQHAIWGVRGLAPDFDARMWRLPQGRREVEELIAEMRRYTPMEHTGDRLISLWLADSRIRTKGKPLPLLARSS